MKGAAKKNVRPIGRKLIGIAAGVLAGIGGCVVRDAN